MEHLRTWWLSIPIGTRAPMQSAIVSKLLSLQDILVFAISENLTEGRIHDFHSLVGLFLSSAFWFGITGSLFFGYGPYYRRNQALKEVAAVRAGICTSCGAATEGAK